MTNPIEYFMSVDITMSDKLFAWINVCDWTMDSTFVYGYINGFDGIESNIKTSWGRF